MQPKKVKIRPSGPPDLPSIQLPLLNLSISMKHHLLLLLGLATAVPNQAQQEDAIDDDNIPDDLIPKDNDFELGSLELLSYECRDPPTDSDGNVIPPSEESRTGKTIVITPETVIVKAGDYDWQNTRSIFWDYPRDEHRLEFYSGSVKYATVQAAKDQEFFEIVCGFERGLNSEFMKTIIEVDDKVKKELDGRIFQTKDSYFKIVKWK